MTGRGDESRESLELDALTSVGRRHWNSGFPYACGASSSVIGCFPAGCRGSDWALDESVLGTVVSISSYFLAPGFAVFLRKLRSGSGRLRGWALSTILLSVEKEYPAAAAFSRSDLGFGGTATAITDVCCALLSVRDNWLSENVKDVWTERSMEAGGNWMEQSTVS